MSPMVATKEKERQMVQQDVTDFYDVEVQSEEGIPTGIKNKGIFYHLAVTEGEVGSWDDGRVRLDIKTEVASGEYAGKYGPRKTFSLGGYEGTGRNGRPFTVSATAQADALVQFVRAAHPARISFTQPVGKTATGDYVGMDENTLADIAEAIVGAEFIAKVRTDAKGYLAWSHVHSLSAPPVGFELEAGATAFTL